MTKHTLDSNRRKLLQLGAVGMPMMFTLRASAQSAVVSALQCTIDIPSDWVILVGVDGAAWIGGMNWSSNKTITQKVVDDLKADSSFAFPAGAIDAQFRPDGVCDPVAASTPSGNNKKPGKSKKDISCLYNVYEMSGSAPFPVSDVVDVNGNWNLQGTDGLYVSLATQYAAQNGNVAGFPGVSCLVSVLNFIQTNN